MLALGVITAVAASVLFNVGVALQALDARVSPPEEALRLRLLWRLLRRRRWLLGLVLGAIGVPLQIAGFTWAPFATAQPLLATGLIVLLVIGARVLDEHVGLPEILGVVAIAAGTALVSVGAPTHVEHHRGPAIVAGVVAALLALSLVPFARRGSRIARPIVLAAACGIAFAATNIAAKLLADDFATGHWLNVLAWLGAAAVTGVVAILGQMSAFQRAAAISVVPVSFSFQTFLPIALEPLFLRETFASAPAGGWLLAGGAAVMLAGSVAVARNRVVSALFSGAPGPARRERA